MFNQETGSLVISAKLFYFNCHVKLFSPLNGSEGVMIRALHIWTHCFPNIDFVFLQPHCSKYGKNPCRGISLL